MKAWIDSATRHGAIAGVPIREDEGRVLTARLEHERLAPDHVRHTVRLHSNVEDIETAITFDVRSPFPLEVPTVADAALLVALFPALHHGGELRLEGDVTRRLARNLIDLQAIWFRARPDRYRPFRLVPTGVVDEVPAPSSENAVLPLTGGVDSLLALCRHTDPARPLGDATVALGGCVFIPGLSPRLDRLEEFPAAIAKVRALAATRDLPLVVAETNFTDVVRYPADSHGALLAAVPTLLARHFSGGLIASSLPHLYPGMATFGSAPHLDPFFSSTGFEIRDDAGDMTRGDKVAALSKYEDMLEHLVVCFDVPGLTGNCCRCQKCTRTMLQFLALGSDIPAAAFPQPMDPRRIGKRLGFFRPLRSSELALETADARGVSDPMLRKLGRALRWKRLKYQLRTALMYVVPGIDLTKGDAVIPGWLIERRARAQAGAARDPSWEVTPPGRL